MEISGYLSFTSLNANKDAGSSKSKADARQGSELRQPGEDEIPPERRDRATDPGDLVELSQELSIHRIELEQQGEELRQTVVALEEARSNYFDLFDQAPVGYVTLDAHDPFSKQPDYKKCAARIRKRMPTGETA